MADSAVQGSSWKFLKRSYDAAWKPGWWKASGSPWMGPIATQSATAEVRRSATQAKQADALRKWNPSDLPSWLDEEFYREKILPRLAEFTVKKIRLAIKVSHPYAALIKRGLKIPHPRHWPVLAELAGITFTRSELTFW